MGREMPTQAPSSPLVKVMPPHSGTRTLLASGATTRKRMRRSELTWGYCLPSWLEVAGLKSSFGAAWAGASLGGAGLSGAGCASASWPASRDSNARPSGAVLMTMLLPLHGQVRQLAHPVAVAVAALLTYA